MQKDSSSLGYYRIPPTGSPIWFYQFTEKGWEYKYVILSADKTYLDDCIKLTAIPDNNFSAYDKQTAGNICQKQLKTGKPKSYKSPVIGYPSYADNGMCTYAGARATHGEMLHMYCENAVELMTVGLCGLLTKNNIPYVIPDNNPCNGIWTPIRQYIPQPFGNNWNLFKRPGNEFKSVGYFDLLTDISHHVSVTESVPKDSETNDIPYEMENLKTNLEIQSLVKTLGLEYGKVYKSSDELRYRSIVLMTENNADGYYIKKLLIKFINYYWPSLTTNLLHVFTQSVPKCLTEQNQKKSESRTYCPPRPIASDFDGDNENLFDICVKPTIRDLDNISYERIAEPPTAKIAFRSSNLIAKDSVENFFVEKGISVLRNLYADTYVRGSLVTDAIVQLCKTETKVEFHVIDFNGKKERIRFINGTCAINITTGVEHTIGSIYY